MGAAPPTTAPSAVRRWLMGVRPATLPAAAAPVIVGTACAYASDAFDPGPALAALFGGLMIQVGTNLANDVFDYERGVDTEDRSGPVRVTQAGLLSPGRVKAGMALSFALAAAAGAYLIAHVSAPPGTWRHGVVVLAIGIASILSGIAYTAGPYPLGARGLADVFVFLFFGLAAVCGTTFVQARAVPATAWFAGVAMGCLSTALLVVNNVRDRATDRRAGKRTLPVRFGRRAGLWEYTLLVAAAYATPWVLLGVAEVSTWILMPWASLPIAAGLVRALWITPEGPALNRILTGTGRLTLLYGALLAAGIAFGPGR